MDRNRTFRLGILSTLVTLAALLSSSDADAQQLKQAGRLSVFDANGKRVGRAIDLSPATIALNVQNHLLVLYVYRDYFRGTTEGPLFTSSDCSGAPLIRQLGPPGDSADAPAVPLTAVGGNVVYVPAPSSVPQVLTVNSGILPEGGCFVFSGTRQVVDATQLFDLNTVFIPPFNVR